jgi:hypothetical protein
MHFVYLLHRQLLARESVQEEPAEFVKRATQFEEKPLGIEKRIVFKRRYPLFSSRAFFGHYILHDLIASKVLADKNQMMAGPITACIPESEGKNILPPEVGCGFIVM